MAKVFIDGSAGTTGLRIVERLQGRDGITLITLPDELRKDPSARAEALHTADVAFLCLPDAAAKEAVALAGDADTVIIDASTAHRTDPAWTYGFPEVNGLRAQIAQSARIANPGCHASGFISLVAPLVSQGILAPDALLTCTSLTGYSGGGKGMIAQYEADERDPLLDAPRVYGLPQAHKHLPEMAVVCGLAKPPVFMPVVGSYYAGMLVMVPLPTGSTVATKDDIAAAYHDYYAGERFVRFVVDADEAGFMSAGAFAGRDDMQVTVFGNDERILLASRFDNLGKGASGAAIQNMNIVLGLDEAEGLVIGEN